MLYESRAALGAELMLVRYQLREPARVLVRWRDGSLERFGLGTGCIVCVWEPDAVYPVGGHPSRTEIPIPGGEIVEFPKNLRYDRFEPYPSRIGAFFDISDVRGAADRFCFDRTRRGLR